MEEINVLLWISRSLHIAAVIVTIGGAAFLRLALLPGANQALEEEPHQRLREAVRKRWAHVVRAGIALLLITGAINFIILAVPPKIDAIPYHPIFGVKVLAAFGVFMIASALVGKSPAFAKLRRNERTWLNVLLALAVVIVLLSGLLSQVRGTQSTAVDRPGPTTTEVVSP